MRSFAAVSAALLLLGAAPAARADDAGRQKLAREVVEVAHAADNMRAVLPVLASQMRGLLAQGGNADAKDADRYVARFQQKLEASIPRFIDLVAAVYAREFTDADLSALLVFYRTDAGQHLLAKQPEIARSMLTVGQEWGKTVAQEVLADMDREKAAAPPPKL